MTEPTTHEVYVRAAYLIAAAPQWPEYSAGEAARLVHSKRERMSRLDFLALQSVHLAIVACSPSGWPPMSPMAFVQKAMPGIHSNFHKFVDAVKAEAPA